MNRMQVSSLKHLALAAISLCLFSAPMSAQTAVKGSFDLPCAVKWGVAVLPAGHYTFALDSTAMQGKLFVRGENQSPIIKAFAVDDHDSVDRDELILARTGGYAFVRTLRLKGQRVTLYYNMPSSVRIIAQNQPEMIQRVPVVINGK